jgi:alcohol dehydrogenase/propanol-preferring alcohol dehydrogenase
VIDALGDGVPDRWKTGQRVGIGWHAWHCGVCDTCRRGDFFACERTPQVTGLSFDGGYADYTLVPFTALALVPEGLAPADAAPLMCAGLTTYNALRNSGAVAGDLVAILGIGGLGHLGVQYAAKMGFRTVALARGQDKAPLAQQLGAVEYIDTKSNDPAADPIPVNGLALLLARRSVEGWYSGTSIDSQDTLNFSRQQNVRSMNETYPLEKAAEGYERMMSGKARFRVVLTTGN